MAKFDRTPYDIDNAVELDQRIVDAVDAGVTKFDNDWFTSHGIATTVDVKAQMGILSCPRFQESGGDTAYLNINGKKCTFKGTSNLRTAEYEKYLHGGSNGTGTVRTAAAAPAVPFADWLQALKQFKAAGLNPQIVPNVPKTFNITLEEVMNLI